MVKSRTLELTRSVRAREIEKKEAELRTISNFARRQSEAR